MNRRPRAATPIHPGEILRDEIAERGLSLNQVARDSRIPLSVISLIANGKRSITAETALRLGRYFGTSAALWLNLQNDYDRRVASAGAARIEPEVTPARFAKR